jgi:putative salt-induced outer membrane protein YdiY
MRIFRYHTPFVYKDYEGDCMLRTGLAAAVLGCVLYADAFHTQNVAGSYDMTGAVDAKKPLEQKIDIGFANTTGNTDTLNLNAKYALLGLTEGYAGRELKYSFDAGVYLTENDGTRDNEEYTLNAAVEQMLEDEWLLYGTIRWLRNTFRNYDSKTFVGIGVGKKLVDTPKHLFTVKLGTAYNDEVYSDEQPDQQFGSLTEYAEYRYRFSAKNEAYVQVGASENFEDFDDYEILSVLGVDVALNDTLHLVVEEEIRYDNVPPVGFEKTDTKSIVRLGYTF